LPYTEKKFQSTHDTETSRGKLDRALLVFMRPTVPSGRSSMSYHGLASLSDFTETPRVSGYLPDTLRESVYSSLDLAGNRMHDASLILKEDQPFLPNNKHDFSKFHDTKIS